MNYRDWMETLSSRERKEILLSKMYAKDFSHGTPGHQHYLLIAKLASMLDNLSKPHQAESTDMFESECQCGCHCEKGGDPTSLCDDRPLREMLADYAHRAWSGWMKYLFSKTYTIYNGRDDAAIIGTLVDRWRRQMTTDFKDLPESEKQSDYKEADEILAIVRGYDLEESEASDPQRDSCESECGYATPSYIWEEALLEVERNWIDICRNPADMKHGAPLYTPLEFHLMNLVAKLADILGVPRK